MKSTIRAIGCLFTLIPTLCYLGIIFSALSRGVSPDLPPIGGVFVWLGIIMVGLSR